jgi:hypothetical protein
MADSNIKYQVSEGYDDTLDSENPVTTPTVEMEPPTVHLTNLTKIDTLNADEMTQRIMEYVQTHRPKLYILTPCFGSMCYVNYVQSMVGTIELFRRFQIPIKFEFCKSDSLVPRARNNLIARAMADPDMTHMMFIDNDITWNPIDILRMVMANKPLVGGIYPLKRYDWSKLVRDPLNPYNTNMVQAMVNRKNQSNLSSFLTDEMAVQSNLLKYNVNYLGTYMQIDNNLSKVRHIPTGFMLIQRMTIEAMFKAYPETKYTDDVNFLEPSENTFAYALFDCRVEEGHYFSEDWLFCERWLRINGEVWADVSVNLTHTGIEDYRGSYIASMV